MENFLISVRCVTPVLLTICLGMWVRVQKLVPDELYGQLSILSFHFLLPFQVFHNIYAAKLEGVFSVQLLLYLEGGTILWFLINYVVFSKVESDRRTRGAYIQNAFRSNIAVVGVSLAQSVMGASGVALMSIMIAVVVPTYNILAVITLETCRGGKAKLGETGKMILKNPLIGASVLGIVCLILELRLPQPVEQTVKNVGTAGSVMTLVSLGASLYLKGTRRNMGRILFCNVYRLLIAPLILVGGACFLGFRGDALCVILLCAGSPTATTAYTMALACDSDHELTAQIVATSSLLFCFTMIFWIFTLKQLRFL